MRAALCVIIFSALPLGAHCAADVRLVDEAGGLANVGLLQVATEAGFGTVCGANAAAADAAWPSPFHSSMALAGLRWLSSFMDVAQTMQR